MSRLLQLIELIPMETPLGKGYAIMIESGEHDYYWTIALNDSKALVTFKQDQLRICNSYTHGRGINNDKMKAIINEK